MQSSIGQGNVFVLKYVKGLECFYVLPTRKKRRAVGVSEQRQILGKRGEELAIEHLKHAGHIILECNYRCPLGEMDIIARDGETIVFVEVRTRSTGRLGWGEESITSKKRMRLNRIASHYIKYMNYQEWPSVRFDVIAIRSKIQQDSSPDISWIRGI